ncbi:hypothetical protein CABS01_02003 [Colletotrichum abscissum]|uniref:Uncharacterized protein n=1 Tax=Colletotrichum abscissum TaxID=1671311 RepID=A0A9Q0B1M5_9PEZI|nr:uncharacterized protein CABS01_02003 [Colletotrichum abscissum]KAI3544558.1 hypothetical protein CABS02_09666 [Colletotrichum abscissum]KAK1488373.1 hypothetical protein CABS01_02003 [Colletotrichum abscissum]
MCPYNLVYWPICCGRRLKCRRDHCHFARNDPQNVCLNPELDPELVTRDFPCNECIFYASLQQMAQWVPDPVKRKKLVRDAPSALEKERRDAYYEAIRIQKRAARTVVCKQKREERRENEADRAAAAAAPRTPTQADFMNVDGASSSSQGGNAFGK